MRIDLTQGAFRILTRAETLSQRQGISVAWILLALFEEEESRAFQWLEEKEIRVEEYRLNFGLYEGLSETLHSPISAPPFPMGSYGVPPEANSTPRDLGTPGIGLSDATQREYPTGYDPSVAERTPGQGEKENPPQPAQSPVPPPLAKTPPQEGFQSPRRIHDDSRAKAESSAILWFLDEEPVRFSKVQLEVDHAVFAMVNTLRRSSELLDTSFVLGNGGMVMRIKPNYELGFLGPSFELASEHLLLALVLSEDMMGVGRWLRDKGLDPKSLLERIDTIYNRTSDFALESLAEKQEATPESEEKEDSVTENNEQTPEEPEIPETKIAATEEPRAPLESPLPRSSPEALESSDSRDRRIVRLLDASINRAREAIRVLEDYARFVLDDSYLSAQFKSFRHDFSAWSSRISQRERILARDTEGDVGTKIEGSREYLRETLEDVLASNFSRLQESLRSLEEYSKVVASLLARDVEQLRYRSYTLHKLVLGGVMSREKLEHARLYVLLGAREHEGEFAQLVRTLIASGVDVIQLRDKKADDRVLLSRGRMLRELTAGTRTLFIMNDRVDLAKLCKADGVHLGQEELGVREARDILGGETLIGLSTHSIEQARKAVLEGANYIGVGPTFPSTTKKFVHFPGLDFLREVAEEIRIPAFAIGGITLENLSQVLQSGVKRVALGAAILNALEPAYAAEEFHRKLNEAIANAPHSG